MNTVILITLFASVLLANCLDNDHYFLQSSFKSPLTEEQEKIVSKRSLTYHGWNKKQMSGPTGQGRQGGQARPGGGSIGGEIGLGGHGGQGGGELGLGGHGRQGGGAIGGELGLGGHGRQGGGAIGGELGLGGHGGQGGGEISVGSSRQGSGRAVGSGRGRPTNSRRQKRGLV